MSKSIVQMISGTCSGSDDIVSAGFNVALETKGAHGAIPVMEVDDCNAAATHASCWPTSTIESPGPVVSATNLPSSIQTSSSVLSDRTPEAWQTIVSRKRLIGK